MGGDRQVDLDLVELRAKLRGWECRRLKPGSPIERVDVVRPQRTLKVYRDGRMTPGLGLYACLTRPRLTLADIVASPPEGWTAVMSRYGGACFQYADGRDAQVNAWPDEPPASCPSSRKSPRSCRASASRGSPALGSRCVA